MNPLTIEHEISGGYMCGSAVVCTIIRPDVKRITPVWSPWPYLLSRRQANDGPGDGPTQGTSRPSPPVYSPPHQHPSQPLHTSTPQHLTFPTSLNDVGMIFKISTCPTCDYIFLLFSSLSQQCYWLVPPVHKILFLDELLKLHITCVVRVVLFLASHYSLVIKS